MSSIDSPVLELPGWVSAIAAARMLSGSEVRVPKSTEPDLPDIPLRRANVPFSVHKGAWRVYREEQPGQHVQIREYPDYWTVELDQHNPRYQPLSHIVVDTPEFIFEQSRGLVSTPVESILRLTLFSPIRSIQFTHELGTTVLDSGVRVLDRTLSHVGFSCGLLSAHPSETSR